MDVNDLPSLDWIRKLPSWVQVRYGSPSMTDNLSQMIVLHVKLTDGEYHVDWVLDDSIESSWQVAFQNLASQVFEHWYPGKFLIMIKEEARAAFAREPIPEEIVALRRVYTELNTLAA